MSKKVRTIHPLTVADSLKAQNDAVNLLVSAVDAFLKFHADAPGADILRKAMDNCRAAMWPEKE